LLPLVFPPFLFVISYLTSKLRLFDMFRIDAVKVAAVSDSGKNGFSVVHWRCKGFAVEVALPR
jgi:hypothetical protein